MVTIETHPTNLTSQILPTTQYNSSFSSAHLLKETVASKASIGYSLSLSHNFLDFLFDELDIGHITQPL